jgi:hypothetical protein
MRSLGILIFLGLVINNGFSQGPFKAYKWDFEGRGKASMVSESGQNDYLNGSFYKLKDSWKKIIDTTWGPGAPLADKLALFDKYAAILTDQFAGFGSLGINRGKWELIKSSYREQINSSTSEGAFAAIMGHFSFGLYDAHSYAGDTNVLNNPLRYGIPILMLTPYDDGHFGATLTPLPDSSILVLWAIKNHPLNLKPGDVIVGYEGIPWKNLVDELFLSGIPFGFQQRNLKSSSRHNQLASAGMNWHLFDTIDIIRYGSTDTIHLSVDTLKSLKSLSILPKEQLPVPGVPFPDPENINTPVYYGKVEGSNIGYIYIFGEISSTDLRLSQAIKSLSGTDGLIIDLRKNVGGWPCPQEGLGLLFNSFQYTLEDYQRCNPYDFSLCTTNDKDYWSVQGNPSTWYEKPVAVLTGPNCVSNGEYIAYILTYRTTVRFFGKPTCGALGWESSDYIDNTPGWWFAYSPRNAARISDPGNILTYKKFPVDETIWFDRESAAKGEDPVAQKAIQWIKNYSFKTEISDNPLITIYPNPADDFINIKINCGYSKAITIEILSMTGQIKYSSQFYIDKEPFMTQINISGFTGGIYLLRVKQSENISFEKFIVF